MRLVVSSALVCWVSVCPHPALAQAPKPAIPAQHHPWGRFKPGAWKAVRVETETFDEKGILASRSFTDTETTLIKVEQHGVTLRVEVVVHVAGKPFKAEPETIKQGFHGVLPSEDLKFKQPVPGQVKIEGQTVPCRIFQAESSGPTTKTLTTIYYSDAIWPYVLRRRSVTTDLEGKTTLGDNTVAVVALDMPCEVLKEMRTAALVRAVQKHAKGTITTWAYTSTEVPGGVVSHSSKELDDSRRLIRRSTLRLTAYGLEPKKERPGLLGRRRLGRLRKPKLTPRYSP